MNQQHIDTALAEIRAEIQRAKNQPGDLDTLIAAAAESSAVGDHYVDVSRFMDEPHEWLAGATLLVLWVAQQRQREASRVEPCTIRV